MIIRCPSCGHSLPASFQWLLRRQTFCSQCRALLRRRTPLWMPLIAIPAAVVAALCTLPLLDRGGYWFLLAAPLAIGVTLWCAFCLCDRCVIEWAITSRCVGCNYDLRGNTTGLCPECGREIAT